MTVHKSNGNVYVIGEEGFIEEGSTPRNHTWTEDILQAKDFKIESNASQFICDAQVGIIAL